jgi:aryl-alcohol dehydrogenase-like predicted oxidoreductase
MQTRVLGRTGVEVSRIGLGGFEIGPEAGEQPDMDRAVTVLRASAAAGITWLDTSENYHDTANESLIGTALAASDSDLLVSTKVAPAAAITGGGSGFLPAAVRTACHNSLRRLHRDVLDVYLLHWPDDTGVPLEDTWGAMSELVDAGLVRAIGLSNYDVADVERCHAQRPVDVVQDGLSLIDYLDARAAFARYGELGIGVVAYEPLASGILTGKSRDEVLALWTGPWLESAFFTRLLGPGRVERSFAVADGVRLLADSLGVAAAQLALAWVLHQPGVSGALAGSRDGRHMLANAVAADLDIASVLDALDELIPLGPNFAAEPPAS